MTQFRRLNTIASNILKVNQLIDIYMSSSLRSPRYRTRIEEITSKSLIIGMPFDKGVPVFASVGRKIYGKVITDSSPYVFISYLLEKQIAPLPIWIIDYPAEITKIQQREVVRIDVKLNVTVTLIDEEDALPEQLIVNDISAGGVRLVSPRTYPNGTKLLVAIKLSDQETIEVLGEVIRSEQPLSDASVYWVGVKFTGIHERQRNKIVKFVFQKQLERHRRGF